MGAWHGRGKEGGGRKDHSDDSPHICKTTQINAQILQFILDKLKNLLKPKRGEKNQQ